MMPTKPTPTPDAATLAQCQQLGATCLRYHGQHWALRDTPIWELYRDNGGQLERRLLGYPGGDWREYEGTLPLDVQAVNKEQVSE
jgi:hypothetical protein